LEWPARFRAAEKSRSGSRSIWVGPVALGKNPKPAELASTATDGRRDHDAVALTQISDVLADFFDDADAFVTKDRARTMPVDVPAHHVQIGAADGARRQPDHGVGRSFYFWVGDGIEPNVADSVKNDCFYAPSHYRRTCRRNALTKGFLGGFAAQQPPLAGRESNRRVRISDLGNTARMSNAPTPVADREPSLRVPRVRSGSLSSRGCSGTEARSRDPILSMPTSTG
jgi:hypothetical protein